MRFLPLVKITRLRTFWVVSRLKNSIIKKFQSLNGINSYYENQKTNKIDIF